MNSQDELRQLVKIKGVGKTMSKSLDSAQLESCSKLLLDPTTHIATKSTFLVAFIMLKNTQEEQTWFNDLKENYKSKIPADCYFLFDKQIKSNQSELIAIIHRVLNKHDLTKKELKICCDSIIGKSTDSHFKAAILEALRLKEESSIENDYFLNYFYTRCRHHKINVPILIDLSTAYDGFNRHPNLLLSLAVLLGAIGFPTILHGCKDVSPKFGLTINKALTLAKKNPYHSLIEVQKKLENTSIRWAYIDQHTYFSEFHDLVELRTDLVKRPILATIEKFMQPIIADSTYVVSGYTHPAYRQKTIKLLQQLPNCTDFLFVRGVEGSALAPIDRRCPTIYSTSAQHTLIEGFSSPDDYSIEKNSSILPNTQLTQTESNSFCMQALTSSSSDSGQWLIYCALMILTNLKLIDDPNKTKLKLISAIDSQKAIAHWNAY
jgi:anthranilate phosphoribosyltransferase